jgi:hypothetical protein
MYWTTSAQLRKQPQHGKCGMMVRTAGVRSSRAAARRRVAFWAGAAAWLALHSVGVAASPSGRRQSVSPRGGRSSQIINSGAIIPLRINNTVNSHTAYVGEAIYAETIFPVTENDRMLIPAHSFVRGSVTDVVQPGHLVGKAQLGLRFDSLTLPDGVTRPIKCIVYSIAGARLVRAKSEEEGETGGKVTARTAPSAEEAGSVIDAGGLGGVSALSAASAGVGGLVLMLVSHNKEILLQPGTTLEIQLIAPLNLAAKPPEARGPPRLKRRPEERRHHGSGGASKTSATGGRSSR